MDDMDILGKRIDSGLSKSAALNEMSGGDPLGLSLDSDLGSGGGLAMPALKKSGSKLRHSGKSVNKSKKVSLPKVPGVPKIKGVGKAKGSTAAKGGVKLPGVGKIKLPKL